MQIGDQVSVKFGDFWAGPYTLYYIDRSKQSPYGVMVGPRSGVVYFPEDQVMLKPKEIS